MCVGFGEVFVGVDGDDVFDVECCVDVDVD